MIFIYIIGAKISLHITKWHYTQTSKWSDRSAYLVNKAEEYITN